MPATKSLNDLLLTFMQDVYYAERQILKALPKMARAAQNETLKQAFLHHRVGCAPPRLKTLEIWRC